MIGPLSGAIIALTDSTRTDHTVTANRLTTGGNFQLNVRGTLPNTYVTTGMTGVANYQLVYTVNGVASINIPNGTALVGGFSNANDGQRVRVVGSTWSIESQPGKTGPWVLQATGTLRSDFLTGTYCGGNVGESGRPSITDFYISA